MKNLQKLFEYKPTLNTNKNSSVNLSIIIYFFNHRNFVIDAISSVINQVNFLDEIIIIDDASQDGTKEIAVEYLNSIKLRCKTTFFSKKINKGFCDSINSSTKLAFSDNLVCLAGDDYFLENSIENIRNAILNNRNYSIIFGSSIMVDSNKNFIGKLDYKKSFIPDSLSKFCDRGISDLAGHSQNCWNKKLFSKFGPLSYKVTNEDDQLIFRSRIIGNILIISEPTRAYRISPNGMSYDLVNLGVSFSIYQEKLVHQLKNRVNNHLLQISILIKFYFDQNENIKVSSLVSSLSSNIVCLRLFIKLMQISNIFQRARIFLEVFFSNNILKSSYLLHAIIALVSPFSYFYLKRMISKIRN